MVKFKCTYLGTPITSQNYTHEEDNQIKFGEILLPLISEFFPFSTICKRKHYNIKTASNLYFYVGVKLRLLHTERRVLRRIFGTRMKENKEDWRNLNIRGLHKLFSSQKYFRNNTIKTKRYERCSKY
jgi:hypothetical protein